MYSAAVGYGFQPSKSPVTAVSRGGSDLLRGDYCTSVDSFSFSLNLPLGNYTVNVYLGDLNGTSVTSVYGEQRRLFIDRLATASGQTVARSFTINRRDYKNGNVTISRTDRELTYADFDSVLNFTFAGSKIAVCGIDVAPAAASVTTIFVCGNSTAVDQPAEPFCSWPQMITRMFNQQVSIADYAESGLTAGSFISEHRLDMIGTVIKPGDYVLAEFGHNDQKNATDVANYPSNLKQYSDFAKSHNATPIFVTPTARANENDSATSIAGLAQVMRQTAKTDSVKLIDLNAMVIALHKSLGSSTNVALMYADPTTHFTDYGAFEDARCVARGIVGLNLVHRQRPGRRSTAFRPVKSRSDRLLYNAHAHRDHGAGAFGELEANGRLPRFIGRYGRPCRQVCPRPNGRSGIFAVFAKRKARCRKTGHS